MIGSILIIARNNLPLTKVAVRTALAQDYPCHVLVIDNASTDGTNNWLKTKDVAAITYPIQKSLAACWNAGIKAFWDTGATEVLVLNNDVSLRPDTYYLLHNLEAHMVTCVSVNKEEQLGVPGDRSIDGLVQSLRPHPDFSAFMIRKTVTNRVGWFDETYYPAYCEDCDYHVRMHRAGMHAVCVDLPFLHLGANTLRNASPGEQDRIRRGADTNRERFRKRYGCLPGSPEYSKLFAVV